MSRPRTIPDSDVFAAILHLMAVEGEKAVAFSSVARATGLSAPSLVQRYGALPQMINAALLHEWAQIEAVTVVAIADTSKGPQGLLKSLTRVPSPALLAASLRDAALRDQARAWRVRVEAALAGLGDKEGAAMLFAVWQGQMQWEGMGDKGFKVKDAIKRLS